MIRFGMSGCGGFIEHAVLPMMQKAENAEAVAAFDVDGNRLSEVCRRFSIRQACSRFADLLANEDVDAVYVACPNALHRDQVVAAAEAGKHVFCQKPLGLNAAECKDMIAACRNNGIKLGVGFCYRFGGAQQQILRMITDGIIGDVSYFHFSFNLGGYTPDTVGWRCDPKLSGGGPLMDLAPHMIDLARFFLGDRVESVMAYVEPERTDTQIEYDVQAILHFANGSKAALDLSFNRRGNTHNYTLVGSRGQIRAVGTMPWLVNGEKVGKVTCEANYAPEQEIDFPIVEHIEEEIRAYCAAIERDEEPPVPGEAGMNAQAVIDAIYESGRTGKRCVVQY